MSLTRILRSCCAPVTRDGNVNPRSISQYRGGEETHGRERGLAVAEVLLHRRIGPGFVVLRRQDGAFMATFSVSRATKEGIVEAAKEDYWGLLGGSGAPEGPENARLHP